MPAVAKRLYLCPEPKSTISGWKLDGRRNGHEYTHLACCPDAVGFANIRNQNVSRVGRKFTVVFPQKGTGAFKYHDTELAFNVVRMDG